METYILAAALMAILFIKGFVYKHPAIIDVLVSIAAIGMMILISEKRIISEIKKPHECNCVCAETFVGE